MKSPKYWAIRRFYHLKLWAEKMVRLAVRKKWITETEFFEITGKIYNEG